MNEELLSAWRDRLVVGEPLKFLDRVADPSETVEITVEGRGLLLGVVLLLGACYLVAWPPASEGTVRWLAAVVSVALLSSLLRDVKWFLRRPIAETYAQRDFRPRRTYAEAVAS